MLFQVVLLVLLWKFGVLVELEVHAQGLSKMVQVVVVVVATPLQ